MEIVIIGQHTHLDTVWSDNFQYKRVQLCQDSGALPANPTIHSDYFKGDNALIFSKVFLQK